LLFQGCFNLILELMRRERLILLLLAALTLAVYWPVRHHEFILFDDTMFVTENPVVQAGLSLNGIFWAFTHRIGDMWHPLTAISHMLDCELFGLSPGPMHFENALFHVANALLLFLVLHRATGFVWRSAIVAALFALHPLRVEPVAWLSERNNVLSTFFLLLTLWCYVRFVEEAKLRSPEAKPWYRLTLVVFTIGLLSKPMLVTLPCVMLLLDYWPLRRFEFPSQLKDARNVLPLVREKIPFFSLTILFSLATLMSQGRNLVPAGAITFPERAANAILSYVLYIVKTFWPTRLAVLYPHPAMHHHMFELWPLWLISVMALLLLAVSVFCIVQARRRPYLAVGWFWYLGTMVPVIGLVQVGQQGMADRHSYVPMIGFVLGFVWLIAELWRPGPLRKPVLAVATCVVLAACLVLTHRQVGYWQDTLTLFEHTVDVTPQNPAAHIILGNAYMAKNDLNRAIAEYKTALTLHPFGLDPMEVHFNMGMALQQREEWDEAAKHFEAVLPVGTNSLQVHLHLADVLVRLGRLQEATLHMETALRLRPDVRPQSLSELAWVLATSSDDKVRDGAHAVQFAQRACELTRYSDPGALGVLAAAYAEVGRFSEAVTTAEMACRAAGADEQLTRRNQQVLQSCRDGKPFRETPPAIISREGMQTN
jgi:cytochrome c-type biogenesis protein CcmH/NrfG